MNCPSCRREARSLTHGRCHACYERERKALPPPAHPGPDLTGAACAETDPEWFYACDLRTGHERDELTARALLTCARCPVLVKCREWAIRHEVHGVWGGLTPAQRSRRRGVLAAKER